ncbi:MAG TPA: VWA domain-containing protein [Bryobacteraceae bacterium]|nr:VWA domain-containing protein [Bryobacteraceae bacterium]
MSDSVSRRSFLFSATALLAAAQDQPKFSTDVKVVSVLATVRDKKGQIVHSLTKDDFSIEEDTRPQTIRYFSQESDLPLTLGLLVDTSMSQRNVLGQEQSASYRFFDQVLRPDKDKAFVIHFDHDVELLKDLTSSKKDLDAALAQLETPQLERRDQSGGGGNSGGGGYPGGGGRGGGRRSGGGGTLLYDAILLGSNEIMKKQQGRKAIILLTDGVDRGSKTPLPGAIESAQRADTLVYSILFADKEGFGSGLGGPGMGRHGGYGGGGRRYPQQQRPDGKKILEQISKETGGGFFEVSKKQPIEQIYEHIQEELRSQYSLGYTPDKAEAGYHKITVTVKEKALLVQARDGYYAGG